MTEEQVVKDLELAACCGTPPYSPDTLLEIVVDEDRVWARLPEAMAAPRRLSRSEGFVLSAAAHLIATTLGESDSDLLRAVAKLDAALGTNGVIDVEVEGGARLGELRRAVKQRRLSISYYVPHRDELTERVINPLAILLADGNAYVEAYCEGAEEIRLFRVDRIEAVADVGPQGPGLPAPFHTPADIADFLADAPVVTVAVDASARWIADSVPAASVVGEEGAATEVELRVASERWLATLLLQAGPGARVVGPLTFVNVAADLADEVLANY
jgi:proteasome accessory factor C